MKKINLVGVKLPCTSIDCILSPNRTLAVEQIIAEATQAYRNKHGGGYEVVTGFRMVEGKVVMELWQVPRAGLDKVTEFTLNACK